MHCKFCRRAVVLMQNPLHCEFRKQNFRQADIISKCVDPKTATKNWETIALFWRQRTENSTLLSIPLRRFPQHKEIYVVHMYHAERNSDRMNMDAQWHLRASVLTMLLAMPIPSIAYGCGRTEFSELNGSISSVNYPSQYSNNIYCTYYIRSPGLRQSVFIKFTDFDTEASLDRVEIWCSTSISSKQTFSGRNISPSSFQLQRCNYAIVRFRTNGLVVGRGFRLVFYWLISGCGRTEFSEQSGYVSSPNYPLHYSDNVNCTYSVRSPGLHQSVFIGFTDFDTDTVQIWCATDVTKILSFSGRNASLSSFTLQTCKDVKVSLRTDYYSIQGRGFKLFFYWTLPEQNLLAANLTTASSVQTDFPVNILAVLASLLGASVFIIILMSMIFAIWRVKGKKTVLKTPSTRLEVCGAVNTRCRSNDGYSLEPISTRRRPESVEYELEDPGYEQMDPPNDNDEDDNEYEYVESTVR